MDTLLFDKNSEQALRKSLEPLQQKGVVLGYYQLQGLLFAIACSPEKIQPSEWFDLIWLNDEPQFDDESGARGFYQAVVGLYEYVGERVRQRTYLPFSADYSEHWQRDLADWCDGMLMGHQYLEDLWLIALDDMDDQNFTEDVDASLCLACTFADLIRAKQLSQEHGVVLTDEHLPEAYSLFCKVLGTYASVVPVWSGGAWGSDLQSMFESLEPVVHDNPCPCGSGVIFAKCCLH